jgi:hypothetical protein
VLGIRQAHGRGTEVGPKTPLRRFFKLSSPVVNVGQDLEKGDYGRVVSAIEEKHICPTFPKAFDKQREAVKHFLEKHEVGVLEDQ